MDASAEESNRPCSRNWPSNLRAWNVCRPLLFELGESSSEDVNAERKRSLAACPAYLMGRVASSFKGCDAFVRAGSLISQKARSP